ncbi:hypothetical protein EJB05_28631, partial [Eragrostis curvula]
MEMELSLTSSLSLIHVGLSAAYLCYRTRGRRQHERLPPAPPGWPVIGHLHLLSDKPPHHAMAELARALRLGSVRAVVISKPDLARAAQTTCDAALASRPSLLSGQILSFGCSDVSFAPAGAYHRTARRVVVSELLSPRRAAASHGAVRAEELRRLLARLAGTGRSSPSSSSAPAVDISECFLNLANDVLCRVAFGRRFPHGEGDKLGAVIDEAQELYAGFNVGDYFPELEPFASTVTGLRRRLKRCLADLREVCDEIVDDHISGERQRVPGNEDFVDVLLRVQKSTDLEVPLTDDNLKALVLVRKRVIHPSIIFLPN